ncbi:MAG: DUF4129 domain-containing protein [Acidothermales bacterium]|nr:DUF4129 domain-containing protein [Acidothermales bacterium]
MSAALAGRALAAPVDISREEAADAARRELSRRIYHEDDPNLLERAVRWVLERLGELLDSAAGAAPGGYAGLVVLLLLAVLVIVAVRLRMGPLAGTGEAGGRLPEGDPTRSAEDHRRLADAHAAAGRWAEALRERLRAVLRELELRGLLEEAPGRTAEEAAREVGRVLPGQADALREVAGDFADVWYGGRRATAAMDRRASDLDAAVRETAVPAAAVPAASVPARW